MVESCFGVVTVAACVAMAAFSFTSIDLANLVEEFVHGLADTLQPENLRHRQIRIGDVPAFRRDLVLDEVSLRSGMANAGPAVPGGVDDVQIVGNLRDEVVNIGVPIAVKGRGEKQPRVVIEEHEAHRVEGPDLVRALREVAPE